MDDLRDYQTQAINELRMSLSKGKRRPVVQMPTGAGKTIMAAAIVRMAREKGAKVIFCVPMISLIDQTVDRFARNGIRSVGVIQAQHELTDADQPVQVASVQTLMRRKIPDAQVVIIDECHKQFSVYEDWFSLPEWKDVPIIGLSATPWAKGMGKIWDDLIIGTTTQELIDKGVLSDFKVFAPAHPDLTGVKTVAGDYEVKGLGKAMNKAPLVADLVSTWLERGEGRPTLCFAVDRVHAKHIQQLFEAAGVPTGYVDAFSTLEERKEVQDKFASGQIKIVCNVGVLTTGVDWDVRCIILARPTKSEILYCLDSETEILTSQGWKGMGQIKVGDCAATMENIETGAGQWSNVISVIERDMEPTESWVEYSAPRANFRVTDRHRMIAYSAHDKAEKFQFVEASKVSQFKGGAVFPTAVNMKQSGVPLTDDELYFIGMMMSDGTWTSTTGSITQSERHTEIIARIEKCLQGCGIGYAKRRFVQSINDSMIERSPRWRFDFSVGKPRAHARIGSGPNATKTFAEHVPGITGILHLLPYLDKDFSPALMAMSPAQFDKFLDGLWDGDGSKKKNVDYTPQSLEICSSRRLMMDRLQALCAINGYTANLRKEHGESRINPIYIITITKKPWRHCGGYSSASKNARPQIEIKPATNERVWCVETGTGTIITRRRGKVTVMGNCQIIGRGLRTAPGKDHCLILDHSDTTIRLGFVTDIHYDKLDDGKKAVQLKREKERLPKECPKCAFLRPAGTNKCPNCGFVAEPVNKTENVDGHLYELVRGPNGKLLKRPKHTVDERQMFYSELILYANQNGYKPGWAFYNFRDRYGEDPDRKLLPVPAKDYSPSTLAWIKHRNIKRAKSMFRMQRAKKSNEYNLSVNRKAFERAGSE